MVEPVWGDCGSGAVRFDKRGPSGEGLTDNQESVFGTNPLNPDTDGDGVAGVELVAVGFDPLDPTQTPST